MKPLYSTLLSAGTLLVVCALATCGQQLILERPQTETLQSRSCRTGLDEMLMEIAGIQLLVDEIETQPTVATASARVSDKVRFLAELEDRVQRLEVLCVVRPQLLGEDELQQLKYGEAQDLVNVLHTIDYYRSAVLDPRLPIGMRANAYAEFRNLPHAGAHITSDVQDAWLRDIRLATDPDHRYRILWGMVRVPGGPRVKAEMLQLARYDDSPAIRVGAIRGLSHYMRDDHVRATLEHLALTDWSVRVRNAARRAVSPEQRDDD